jgi:hypothetical protein
VQSEEKWLWLFEWFEMTGPGVVVRESIWLFPVLEAVHLVGLCLLGGTVLLVDLRMLGLTMRQQTAAALAEQMRPWLVSALGVLIVTGVLLFLSEAVKCYYNQSFWVKMTALPIALAFTFLVRERFARKEELDTNGTTKVIAIVSMTLWFTVAAAGRWIGFS